MCLPALLPSTEPRVEVAQSLEPLRHARERVGVGAGLVWNLPGGPPGRSEGTRRRTIPNRQRAHLHGRRSRTALGPQIRGIAGLSRRRRRRASRASGSRWLRDQRAVIQLGLAEGRPVAVRRSGGTACRPRALRSCMDWQDRSGRGRPRRRSVSRVRHARCIPRSAGAAATQRSASCRGRR